MASRALLVALFCGAFRLAAQSPCANTLTYSYCDIPFELDDAEAAAHPNPYLTVQLHAEFRSPRFRTFLMPAFWDGGRRLVIRFAPTEAGDWIYRLTSNIRRFEGQQGSFTAQASGAAGFVRPANLHHWAYTEENEIGGSIPHLWMGDTNYRFAVLDDAVFRRTVDARAAQKFNHMRGLVMGPPEDAAKAYPGADKPDPAFFRQVDQRIQYLNKKGITADLILDSGDNHLTKLFPTWQQRERYIRYLVARYAPMNITWLGLQAFETYENGRELLKEVGGALKKLDPYQHPRSTDAMSTSGPVVDDGWQNFVSYQSPDDQLGAIEHQLYSTPFVNFNFGIEGEIDADTFRHRLWNAAMDGQYVTYGGSKQGADDSPGAQQMTKFFDFFLHTRHWELEPYFDVDGGRALALEGVEYIVYVEKPGPVEVLLERHGYDVNWFNPITGASVRIKDYKGERFTGEPPDKSHDWVLHISRESRKEGMLRSIKFDSRETPLGLQEIEQNPQKVPFQIQEPSGGTLSVSKPASYAAKLKRETRATRSMMWLWTGDVPAEGQGYRVLGTGAKGTLKMPAGIAKRYPAVMNLRLYGLNANGKVYTVDTGVQLTQ
jgi:hypothetical protein